MKCVSFGWSPGATETFRWTSNKSPKGIGFNGQTDPKALRFFKGLEPGRVIGQKDLKQAEARLVAYIAVARRLIKIFNDPEANLYIEQGKLLGQRVVKGQPIYTLWKANIHACHYDEGPYMMAWENGISVSIAREFQEGYHGNNPEIRQWHGKAEAFVKRFGYLEFAPLKLYRDFLEAVGFYSVYGTITDRQRKDAIAWMPQSIPPTLITNCMIDVRSKLPDEVWIHHHGHDSIVWSVPESKQLFDWTEAIIDKALDVDLPINGMTLNIPRETSIGYSVGDLLDYDKHGFITYNEWVKWREKKEKSRRKEILDGIYGAHLE